jgi:hypothetical protein
MGVPRTSGGGAVLWAIHRSTDEKSVRRHTSGTPEANIYQGAPL